MQQGEHVLLNPSLDIRLVYVDAHVKDYVIVESFSDVNNFFLIVLHNH